jgi:hypothetical protein
MVEKIISTAKSVLLLNAKGEPTLLIRSFSIVKSSTATLEQNQLEKVCDEFAAIRDETRLFHRELESLRQRLQTKSMASIMSVDNWKAHRRKGQTHSNFKTLTTLRITFNSKIKKKELEMWFRRPRRMP